MASKPGRVIALAAILASVCFAAAGEETTPDATTVIANEGRSVTFTADVPRERTGYDSPWHYAHAVRAGDFVYISGIVIGAGRDDELPISRELFRERTERTFELIEKYLATAGAGLDDLIKINTFHVLDGKATTLTIDEQARVIAEANAKYAVEPHPAWTAVGTTGLFSPLGIVEIEMIAYAPLESATE